MCPCCMQSTDSEVLMFIDFNTAPAGRQQADYHQQHPKPAILTANCRNKHVISALNGRNFQTTWSGCIIFNPTEDETSAVDGSIP